MPELRMLMNAQLVRKAFASAAYRPRPPRLLAHVRAACRVRHDRLPSEDADVDRVKRFIRFHQKRHPPEIGAAPSNAFSTHLAALASHSPLGGEGRGEGRFRALTQAGPGSEPGNG